MKHQPNIIALDWRASPAELAARWPRDQRLLWLHSGRLHPRWARWSILASPTATFRFERGRSHLEGDLPETLAKARLTHDALRDLNKVLAATAVDAKSLPVTESSLPFRGGWIGNISYDLGRVIEPRAQYVARDEKESRWPLIELAWCANALIFDHVLQRWSAIGEIPACLNEISEGTLDDGFALGTIESNIAADEYERMVACTIEYIAAGDIFQANIAQTFRAPFTGSSRALAIEAFDRAQPWYGAYLELGGELGASPPLANCRALLSLSPELFLHSTPPPHPRRIITRPIKGTRPAACDPRELRDSIKDQAELNMIVDLMRNDLGRVCEFGSVRVPQPRVIETHPTVHHGVAEITGRLRDGASFSDVLRATFPPGSVTGAQKIRAMQIIDELESCQPRGPYCGAIGFISDGGAMTLNVAIRTMLLEGERENDRCGVLHSGEMSYSAGAGIVADSIPAREQQETLDKAAVVRELMNGLRNQNPGRREMCPRSDG